MSPAGTRRHRARPDDLIDREYCGRGEHEWPKTSVPVVASGRAWH